MREKGHRLAPADLPVEVTLRERGLPSKKLLIIRGQGFVQKNLFLHVLHVLCQTAADGSRVQLMGSQNLPDFPQRHPVVTQADALDQKHRRIKGIIPVTAVAAGGLYDALILIVFQQVGVAG